MKALVKVILCMIIASPTTCSQTVEEQLIGSWGLNTIYEFPDTIILRSDHKYFVYNSNSVSTESLGLTEDLKSDDVIIDGAYTSMTERGIWEYNNATKILTLKVRNILEEWTDFSEAYGKSSEVKFYLEEVTRNKVKLCWNSKGERLCDEYGRMWRDNNGRKTFYQEITKEYIGNGSQTEVILLTGYETELNFSYLFSQGPCKLIIEDKNGKALFSTETAENKNKEIQEIPLRGVTKLVCKVIGGEKTCNWNIKLEIK
jgi:hypothetical protein